MAKVKQGHYIDNVRVQLVYSYAGTKFYTTRYSDALYITDENDKVIARVALSADAGVLGLILQNHNGIRKEATWID